MATDTTRLPRLLTAREVHEATGIPLARVYELTRDGEIPAVRLGRAVRYSATRLSEWIDAGGTADRPDDAA
jgi:excisionase family DNA binding protein